jgi:hypothetical protein
VERADAKWTSLAELRNRADALSAGFEALRRDHGKSIADLERRTDEVECAARLLLAAGQADKIAGRSDEIAAEFGLRLHNAEKSLESILSNSDLEPTLDIGEFADLRQAELIEKAYRDAVIRCGERPAGRWLQANFDRAALLGTYWEGNGFFDAARRRELVEDAKDELKRGAFKEQAAVQLAGAPMSQMEQASSACDAWREFRPDHEPSGRIPEKFERTTKLRQAQPRQDTGTCARAKVDVDRYRPSRRQRVRDDFGFDDAPRE